MQSEGLNSPVNMVPICYDAYQLAATVGDAATARLYLEKMLQAAKHAQGETAPLVAQLSSKLSELPPA